MLTLHASHTPARLPSSPPVPARQPLAEPQIKQLREQKLAGPDVASLLKPAARPQPRPSEHWVPARPGLAARVRASLYPLAAGWRERKADSMRSYLRLASQRRSPGVDALFAEQRALWQAHPSDQLRSLMDPYRRLLANHGLGVPAAATRAPSLTGSPQGDRRMEAQTLDRLLGFFTEEQHAVECLANELAKTELASTASHWARALEEVRVWVKAEYVECVSQSPGGPSPVAGPAQSTAPSLSATDWPSATPSLLAPTVSAPMTLPPALQAAGHGALPSGAALVPSRHLEVAGVRPADHRQALG